MIVRPGFLVALAAALVAQTGVAATQAQGFEPLVVKAAISILGVCGTLISAAAIWLVKGQSALTKKWDAFAVTWYGDPADPKPNGAKRVIYDTAERVELLNGWTKDYDRALGALAEENAGLRRAWQPGDPERRERPRPR